MVTRWIGNSAKIAEQFYLQVTDDHFDQAVKSAEQPEAVDTNTEGKAKHKPKQHTSALEGINQENTERKSVCAFPVSSVLLQEVAEEGFEPPTRGL